jgi:hypothetical protein
VTTQDVKKPHHSGTNQVMGLRETTSPERTDRMTTSYLTRNPFPSLEGRRLNGLIRFERAAFDRVLADCCDRPNSRVDVRLTAADPRDELADPLTYVECCRDCAGRNVDVMVDQRRGDAPIVVEVTR